MRPPPKARSPRAVAARPAAPVRSDAPSRHELARVGAVSLLTFGLCYGGMWAVLAAFGSAGKEPAAFYVPMTLLSALVVVWQHSRGDQ